MVTLQFLQTGDMGLLGLITLLILRAGLLCYSVPEATDADHFTWQESAHHGDRQEPEQNRGGRLPTAAHGILSLEVK